jgi:hypothetical protein
MTQKRSANHGLRKGCGCEYLLYLPVLTFAEAESNASRNSGLEVRGQTLRPSS